MRPLTFFLAFLLSSTFVSAQKVIIHGAVTGDIAGKDKIYITDLNAYRDTAIIKDGKFILEIPFQGAKSLFMNAQFERGYRPVAVIFDKPGDINISMDVRTSATRFTGMETPALYNQFRNRTSSMVTEIDEELKKKYGTAYPDQNDSNYNSCLLERDRLSKEKMFLIIKDQVAKYPNTYATAYILADNAHRYPINLQKDLYNKLGPAAKATTKGKEFFAMIRGAENSAIGSKAGDFTLNDADGKPVSLNRFKGNYVLVDFWASWCGPCRASFPRMKQIYEAFHKKGLQILSISIDQNKADWLKAVAQEKLPWQSSLDTKQIAKSHFAVSAIPNLFLIDPDGKILLKEFGSDPQGGGTIEKKLEEIYGQKVGSVLTYIN